MLKKPKKISDKLMGFFVTPEEKILIIQAKPDDVSMSEFLKSIVMPIVTKMVILKRAKSP
ncbi:hypothetical protein NIES2100_05000 [Calothrix sp. NIES-2100]|uniref:hypothetical protein n=1 Tax=Calothrix sp. NIES-2100 TaxID=1954172 RepID=UPI000B5E04EA|nr:hypothetical protein NIES2100_05000 [Calothrix sp. NIES-2100]